jgi:hypothetical protein
VTYVPILKGKKGEFLALKHASAEVQSQIRPVMEIVPDSEVATFCTHAVDSTPDGMVLSVDCSALSGTNASRVDIGGPMMRVGESLGQRQVAMCPVFRITDTQEMLIEVAAVMNLHEQGGCLRASSLDVSQGLLEGEHIRNLLRVLRVDPEEIDLLIDAGPVQSEDSRHVRVGEVTESLERLAPWPWRRICVAAGAFPFNLSGFPRGRATPVKREDALLWADVTEKWQTRRLDFADFGVTHPRMPARSRGAPHPNMRYTSDINWQVFVYAKRRRGNDDFFVLSRDLVDSPYWPSSGARTSWGDERLLECAERERPRAGGGTEWRAWATSHHLAAVTSRLTILGRP